MESLSWRLFGRWSSPPTASWRITTASPTRPRCRSSGPALRCTRPRKSTIGPGARSQSSPCAASLAARQQ
jgi:hypothetical protein